MRIRKALIGSLLACGLPVRSAFAGDGVLEINQTCAVGTGCFAGDAAGFPVTITTRGSYRLTGNLAVDQTTTAIAVSADAVHLDLAGFAISGPNSCSIGPAVACSFVGAGGSGVVSTGEATVLRNGTIRGMGSKGVDFSSDGHGTVEDVVVYKNGSIGIDVGVHGVVRRTKSHLNVSWGIVAETVEHSVSTQNNGGILNAGTVSDCTVTANGGDGISSTAVATVANSDVSGNLGSGIVLTGGGVLTGNTVSNNNQCGAKFGTSPGVSGALGDNHFTGNVGFPLGCGGGGGQDQVSGNVLATSCNVVACTTGTLKLGTFCPPNAISCLP